MRAGSFSLVAGDSSGTTPPATGGQISIAAGTASPGGQRSSLLLLGTGPTGSGGNIILSSTGNILLESPVIATGSSTFGTVSSDTFTVNADAILASAASVAGAFAAHGDVTLGDSGTQSLTVNAQTIFGAATTFSALGNAVVGTNTANSLVVNANTTFAGSAIFNQAFQLYSNSSTAGSGAVLGFQRQNNGSAVGSGFTLGSILFSGYDGAVQGSTAQIRSVFTVRCSELCQASFSHMYSSA